MVQIIDRRLNGKNKSAVNRQRFIRRFKKQIKKSVERAISKRSITDIDSGEKISIPQKDIAEPQFGHDIGGKRNIILPGNKNYSTNDHIKRPEGSDKGQGGEASNQGEGDDDFTFELTKEEFQDIFFEDLALPDLVKTSLRNTPQYQLVRAGYSSKGIPPNINIARSFRNAYSRRLAFRGIYRERLEKLTEQLQQANTTEPAIDEEIEQLKQEIESVKKKMKSIPFIDEFDVRYNRKIKMEAPSTAAVMFCLMDVSGSMDELKKETAKRFFILLYIFLTRTYERIDLVFIRHHTTAKEVDEQEFFYSRETGGTVVSSALEMMYKIMQERYPTDEWNIYAAQASDGDNWNADSPLCQELLSSHIMPYVQYFTYIEIMPRHHQSLWRAYATIKEAFPNFAMDDVKGINEIYPVFHELFKRRN